MQQIKCIYEEVVNSRDMKILLDKEDEIEKLYQMLYLDEGDAYSSQEEVLLKELFGLNQTLQALMRKSLNQMQKVHNMSAVVQKQYDSNFYADAYFVDRKY
ncbi:hypothetical protein [Paenibacillus lactis]|uniref:hypothetical protein n=1 Tax=Paenibacillus lactis TaxID=228574 RepID=UPI0036B68941